MLLPNKGLVINSRAAAYIKNMDLPQFVLNRIPGKLKPEQIAQLPRWRALRINLFPVLIRKPSIEIHNTHERTAFIWKKVIIQPVEHKPERFFKAIEAFIGDY